MPDPDRILRIRTVLQRTGLSRSTLYRKIQDGTFPRQVQISIHGAGWHESAVNRWIADPISYRGHGAPPPGAATAHDQAQVSGG
jgi:prophage regulatory protein